MVIDLLVRLQILRLRDSRNSHQNQIIDDALRQKNTFKLATLAKKLVEVSLLCLITAVEVTQELLHFFHTNDHPG